MGHKYRGAKSHRCDLAMEILQLSFHIGVEATLALDQPRLVLDFGKRARTWSTGCRCTTEPRSMGPWDYDIDQAKVSQESCIILPMSTARA